MLSKPLNTRISRALVLVGALLALSAILVLSTRAPAPVFGQDTGVITYAENGDTPVRTFTSEDPEGAGIHWDVTGIDAADFTISGGVLTFRKKPNFEKPTDRAHGALNFNGDGDTDDMGEAAADNGDGATRSTNTYQITIRASEMRAPGYTGRALSTETHVTVMVTDRNEPGGATLNRRQPEVGTTITASVSDPDGTMGADPDNNPTPVAWQWYISTVTSPVIDAENHWAPATGEGNGTASYTPRGDCVDGTRGNEAGVGGSCPETGGTDPNRVVDENKTLRAVATYGDSFGAGRTARVVSEFPVRAEVSSDLDKLENPANGSPGFDPNLDYTRTVSESLGRGMNVGAPVAATDPNNDTLTYELMALDDDNVAGNPNIHPDAADVEDFSIDMATGQIKVKNTLDFDMNGDPPDGRYKFMVVAIDPSGETAEVEVTVTAKDANDTPKILGSRSATLAVDDPTPGAASEVRVMEQDSDDRSAPAGPDATYYGTSGGGIPPENGTAMGLPTALVLGNQNVFTVGDEDERGQQFWDLRGDDAGEFVLTQGGTASAGTEGSLTGPDEPIALVFVNPPDFEMPTDANGDSVYKVILVARDSAGAEDTRPITIFVDNAAEQGKATLSVEQPYIGTEISATVEDPDNGVGVVTWQWSKTHGNLADNLFAIIHGATASTYTPAKADNGAYLRVTATYIDTTSDMDDPSTPLDERVQKNPNGDTVAKDATMGDGVYDPDGDAQDGETAPFDNIFRVMATSAFAVRVEPGAPGEVTDPGFSAAPYERIVAENAEVGTLVGGPVPAERETGSPSNTTWKPLRATSTATSPSTASVRSGWARLRSPVCPPELSGRVAMTLLQWMTRC